MNNVEMRMKFIKALVDNLYDHIKEHEKYRKEDHGIWDSPKQIITPSYMQREIVIIRAELNELSKML